jgi:hypothetical protein
MVHVFPGTYTRNFSEGNMRSFSATLLSASLLVPPAASLQAKCEGKAVVMYFDRDPREPGAQLIMVCTKSGCVNGAAVYQCES